MSDSKKNTIVQLVKEVQQLEILKDALVKVDQDNNIASHLQLQIFRTFLILDTCVRSWRSSSADERNETQDWDILEDLILKLKRNLKAEHNDLALMPISPLRGNMAVGKSKPFLLMNLPVEMRDMILSQVTSPSCQYNVIKAMPTEASMMKWDQDVIYFDKIFPILMDQQKLEVEDVIKMMKVSKSFADVVTNHFRNSLSDQSLPYISIEGPELEQILQQNKIQLNPIPFQVGLSINWLHLRRMGERERNIVNRIGSNIWDCRIFARVDGLFSRVQFTQLIRDLLVGMPNLCRLVITVSCLYSPQDCQRRYALETPQIRDIIFPNIPHLKHLTIVDYRLTCFPVWKHFLQKYHAGLGSAVVPSPELFPSFPESQDRYIMSGLELAHFRFYRNFRFVPQGFQHRLDSLLGSPLKNIKIRVSWDVSDLRQEYVEYSLTNLMKSLSRFGDTLEDLHVHIRFPRFGEQDIKSDPTWFVGLNFPKVKNFYLKKCFLPGLDFTFLVMFPSLRCLVIEYEVRCFDNSFEQILDPSQGPDSVLKSDVWKLLPDLRSIKFHNNKYSDNPLWSFEVTRAECINPVDENNNYA